MSIGILLYLDLEFWEGTLKTLTPSLQENAKYFTTRSYLTLTEYLQAHLRPVVLLLHHQVQIQPPLSQIPLVLILHLFKTDYQLNDIFPVEITMKNIEIIGRTGTIPFLEMKIQNSYTLEQGILKEFISVTENLGTRKDFGHGMVERDGREKTF